MTWRALTPDELPELLTLAGACAAVDGGHPDAAAAGFLKNRFLGTDRQSAAAWDGPSLLAAVAVRPGPDGSVAAYGLVAPAARGRGLGTELLDRAVKWADGAVLRVETEGLTDDSDALFAARGLIRTFAEDVFVRELGGALPAVQDPPGLGLAEWSPEFVDRFYQTYRKSFGDRPGFPDWSREQWVEWISEDLRPEWTLLATVDGADAGFVACAEGAWVVQVGVVPASRRTGLGGALVGHALRRMAAAGTERVYLDVNENNPGARALYERLGFTWIGRRARYT